MRDGPIRRRHGGSFRAIFEGEWEEMDGSRVERLVSEKLAKNDEKMGKKWRKNDENELFFPVSTPP